LDRRQAVNTNKDSKLKLSSRLDEMMKGGNGASRIIDIRDFQI